MHLKHIAVEALAMTRLTLDDKIGHKLHFDGDSALTLALLASSTFDVERKCCRREAHLLRQGLFGKEFSNLIVGLQVSGGIRTCGFANGILINKFDVLYPAHIALESSKGTWCITSFAHPTQHTTIKDVTHQSRFARTRHSCYYRHYSKREFDVDVLQVILYGATHLNVGRPWTSKLRHRNGLASGQVSGSITVTLSQIEKRTLVGDLSSIAPCSRPHINQPIGRAYDLFVMLHDDDSIALVAQLLEHMDQLISVATMQTDGWFIEDIHRTYERRT